ncbi:FadR/GntR family transcriptional regulator [Nocardia lijiangensis]|uniref:FadR/GntR family transcriptional regulator n=1 Tax=Nocardia lijiangensis TaxID=299618 RepID=UPI001C3FD3C1|nr:FadR/GntR family transcriptional regulator [Nocardia lijiangensis]
MTVEEGRVQRIGATEAVFRRLKGLIQSGEYAVGDRLPAELALAQQFGVSRPVVREALHACATLGLTETLTGRGTFVVSKKESPQLTFAGVDAGDLIEARQLIEIPTAGFAARRHTADQLRRLFELLDKLAAATDTREWVRYDGELHTAIAAASGNKMLTAVVADTRHALDPQSEFLNLTQDRRADSDREHEAIVRAIEAGSPEAAEQAMAEHLERVAETIARIGG